MRYHVIPLVLFTLLSKHVIANDRGKMAETTQKFQTLVMEAAPYLPKNLDEQFISCPINTTKENGKSNSNYRSATDVNYQQPGWEKRIAANWNFFQIPAKQGRVLAIDFSQQTKNNQPTLAFKYLANNQTQHQLYEPWSSSKVMAITATMSQLNKQGVSATSRIGEVPLADLSTSIHSYQPFGKAVAESNDIATFMINTVGRTYATSLFHENWLLLANPSVRLQGAYGITPFKPTSLVWSEIGTKKSTVLPHFQNSADDPAYQGYRCETCGLTGNKPMTALAEAEWLKRLASHEREPLTQHPYLTNNSIKELFYATSHTDTQHQVGGMMQGISKMLTHAIAKSLANNAELKLIDTALGKDILDEATNGEWRIFQKIGWGYSETRSAGETVVLAHVCLPHIQGGREFTIAAQTSVPGDKESLVGDAGVKMQKLLDKAVAGILAL